MAGKSLAGGGDGEAELARQQAQTQMLNAKNQDEGWRASLIRVNDDRRLRSRQRVRRFAERCTLQS